MAAVVKPAGGAALDQVIGASAAAMLLTVALIVLGMGHRSGRLGLLASWGRFSERVSGLPGWAAFPSGVATVSLLTAVFGMYWDISLHIDVGRDPGPLANPAHYFILAGLFGIFCAGFFACVLPLREVPSSVSVKLAPGWYAPLGGVLVCACGAFALIGFPLDDMWHRLFGQDVTLWGPTHLMLIGGASMTLVGLAVLLVEARRSIGASGRREYGWTRRMRAVALTGGFMLGLSTFQGEFDFGVPQFRMVFGPMLVMLAAGVGLIAIRAWAGRGAALAAVAFFLVVRGGLALLVGVILGQATPHFPLYLVEALLVELIALRVRRPLAFGLACGVAIGTVGLAAEWGWSHVWMVLPWPSALFPVGALLGFAVAVSSALLGAWMGSRLTVSPAPRNVALRTAALAGAVVIAGCIGFALQKPPVDGLRASVSLTPAGPGTVDASVTLSPRDAADHAVWFTATAWQGGGLVVDRLQRIGEGEYRSTQPLPVGGNWKTLLRLHTGHSLMAVPVYLPDDPAIPAKGLAAPPHFTRAFVTDHKILQREQKPAGGGITVAAYAVVLAIALALLVLLAWGLHTLGAVEDPAPPRLRFRRRESAAPVVG